ncbi:hypothetical protein D3C72_1512130 [compost metagenome]
MVKRASFWRMRPVSGSKSSRLSISSSNSVTRNASSALSAGKMSMVSPRTRNTPRVNSASLRVYCMATRRARISRRAIWSPARRISTIA